MIGRRGLMGSDERVRPVGLRILVLLSGLVLAGSGACSFPGGNEKRGPVHVDAVELYDFESLAQMAATADVIVEATAVKIEPGRIVGEVAPIQFAQVTLDVDSVLLGQPKTDPILLEEDGTSYPFSDVGDHGVWFLTYKGKGEEPYYRLVGSPGRFLVTDSGAVESSDDSISWARAFEGRPLEDLLSAIREAEASIAKGDVKPAEPIG